ncbi:hypothetical protein KGF54_001906 [Candida jiufengensis]|uniref:uncharacterized protein n=1 Tax=Candida jiufengensis TaxID=497108 RepID=UPI002224348D|nr:uncharacterized protein KGF54_001906 [Candida jiufengensis]KAI5955345.1 hypothetical protein KGF54_001906 [Candida jiufengensis]
MSTFKKPSGFPMIPRYTGNSDDENSINIRRIVGKSNPLRSPDHFTNYQNNGISQNRTTLHSPYKDLNFRNKSDIENEISMTINNIDNNDLEKEIDEIDLNKSYLKYLNSNFDYSNTDNYVEEYDKDYIFSDGDETFNGEFSEDEEFDDDEDHEGHNFGKEPKFYDQEDGEELETPTVFEQINNAKQESLRPTNTSKSNYEFTKSLLLRFNLIFIITFSLTITFFFIKDGSQLFNFNLLEKRKISTRLNYLEDLLNNQNFEIESKFSKLETSIEKIKSGSNSAELIPVSLKHGQLQVSPEFHQYLYQFMENYQKSNEQIESPINPNLDSINDLITKSVESVKSEIESKLESKLSDLNLFNDTISTKNPIILNTIIESILQNSNYINYADFNNGARILGFLTSTKNKSDIVKKMFLGWLDLFSSNVNQEDNANHVIIDDDITWKGGDEIGIRLSKSIIPTDIVIELKSSDNSKLNCEFGFKPKTKTDFDNLKYPIINSTNINTSKFKFIKESTLKPGINHIKLPLRFLNYQIFGKDLYFKFSTNVNLKNIKIYGVNELNIDKLDLNIKKLINDDDDTREEEMKDVNVKQELPIHDLNDDIYL